MLRKSGLERRNYVYGWCIWRKFLYVDARPNVIFKRTDVLRIVKGGVDCHAGGMSLKAKNLYGKAIEWLNEILWMSCLADRSFR